MSLPDTEVNSWNSIVKYRTYGNSIQEWWNEISNIIEDKFRYEVTGSYYTNKINKRRKSESFKARSDNEPSQVIQKTKSQSILEVAKEKDMIVDYANAKSKNSISLNNNDEFNVDSLTDQSSASLVSMDLRLQYQQLIKMSIFSLQNICLSIQIGHHY